MRAKLGLWIACGLVCLGCGKPVIEGGRATSSSAEPASTSAAADGEETTAATTSASATEGELAIGPENTKIGFVGTHVGAEPKPRTGGFEKFSGVVKLDADGKIASVVVDIAADSLWTQHPPLTAHLNAPDFLDTREYPTAKFESTKFEDGAADGEVTVTGDLTLHGVTKEITFPAKVAIAHDKPTLHAEFPLKRAEFGMDKKLDGVHDEVAMTIVIGEKTEKLPETAP
ncbi:MAG: YceI family protein [Planctomycetia bacterium]|nr:YceI family protein [Planctomycetia bacterium]